MDELNVSGERIKLMRLKRGMAQADLAAALAVEFQIELTQSDISEIERKARSVKDFELDAIAKVLDVSLIWLIRGEVCDG